MKSYFNKMSLSPDEIHLIPIDCFRIGVGALSLLYFLRTFVDAPYFLFSDSLINHQLVLDAFWYTWQPLFHSTMPDFIIKLILSWGIILSTLLIIGYHSRASAFILYVIVVCLYRYQFLVLFVDDVIMHLLLFWSFLLPTGKTLTLTAWLKNKNIMNEWIHLKTDGWIVTLIFINIGLIYFVAGVSKFSSVLWIQGTAVFAVLKLPLSRFADYPLENIKIWLKGANYLALIFEPMFVMVVFLKSWSPLKFLLSFLLLIFHTFILITLDIPFANLGCLIFVPIIFHQELTDFFLKKSKINIQEEKIILIPNKKAKIPAGLMIFLLVGAMICALTQDQWRTAKRISGKDVLSQVKISSADSGGPIQTFFYGGLWAMGLAQGYRLLDWIDERNFHQKLTIVETKNNTEKIYGREHIVPSGMRGSLILTYLSQVTWMYVDPQHIKLIENDIKTRIARQYCLKINEFSEIKIWQSLTKIDSFHPEYQKAQLLLSFTCEHHQLKVL